MKSNNLSPAAWALGTTAVIGFVPGSVWSVIDIYALGHYEAKFGPEGTFHLALLMVASFVGVLTGVTLLALLVFPRTVRLQRAWHAGAICGSAAALSDLLLMSGVTGELSRLLPGRLGFLSLLLVIAVPHALLLAEGMVLYRFVVGRGKA